MTTLVLSTDPGTGTVRLTITPTDDVTGVRCTNANGTYDVRTQTGLLPHTAPDVLVLDDYEAAHGTNTYTVTTTADETAGTIVLVLSSPWLAIPEAPQFSAAVPSVLTYNAGVATTTTVHEPDGRHDPIVIVRGGSTRRGSLTVEAGDFPAALNLLRIFQRGQSMLLRQTQHQGMDMYFLPMAADIITARASGASSLFDVSCQYLEVGRPAGELSGALGWTWDALTATGMSWDDVYATYATWGDLLIDRRNP